MELFKTVHFLITLGTTFYLAIELFKIYYLRNSEERIEFHKKHWIIGIVLIVSIIIGEISNKELTILALEYGIGISIFLIIIICFLVMIFQKTTNKTDNSSNNKNKNHYLLFIIPLLIISYSVDIFNNSIHLQYISSTIQFAHTLLLFLFYVYIILNLPFIKNKISRIKTEKASSLFVILPIALHLLVVEFGGKFLTKKILATYGKETNAIVCNCIQNSTQPKCQYKFIVENNTILANLNPYKSNTIKKNGENINVIFLPEFPIFHMVKDEI